MDSGNTSEKEDKFKVKLDMSVALETAGSQNMASQNSVKICPSMPLTFEETARDSSLMDFLEENSFEAMPESPAFSRGLNTNTQSEAGEDGLLCLSFPKKLWKIVESEEYKSIRWNDNGDLVMIEEDFFKVEILERSGPFRIFETDSMKSFIRQLNLYGFSKIRQNQKSISMASQSGKTRPGTRTKFYHNPNFRRDFPYLIERMKRRVGIKSGVLECGSEQLEQVMPGSKRRKNYNGKEVISQSPLMKKKKKKSSKKKSANGMNARMSTSYEVSPAWPMENNNVVDHSIQHGNPNDPNVPVMDFRAINSAYQFPTASGASYEHMMGLQQSPSTYPYFASMNAQLVTLMSFFNPWFSMSMLAAASSVHMTAPAPPQLPSTGEFCPTCNCHTCNETSGNYDLMSSESPESP